MHPMREVPPESLESPGLGIRHYAPRARLLLVESEGELNRVLEREARHHRVGVLLPKEWSNAGWQRDRAALGKLERAGIAGPRTVSRNCARSMTAGSMSSSVPCRPPGMGSALAIRDRLRKAAK